MALEIKKVANYQYTVQTYHIIIGYLVRDDKRVWGFYIERKNVLLMSEDLSDIMNRIKDLTFEEKQNAQSN